MVTTKDDKKNITEREDFYQTLIRMGPDAIFVHSKGEFIFSNQRGINLLGGKTLEEIQKKPVIDYVHPDYKDMVNKRIQDLEISQIEAPPTIEKLIRLDGKIISVEVYGKPIKYKNMDANLSIIRNVTQQLEDQEKLRESDIRKTAILKAIPDLVFIIDKNGIVQYFNVPEDTRLHLPRPRIIGTNIAEILNNDVYKDYLERIKETLETKKTTFLEYQMTIENLKQTYEVRLIYYERDQVLALTRNISKKKAIEEEQLRTIKLESIGLLAGGLAHDFNNILTKIISYVNLAKVDKNNDNALMYLDDIEKASFQAKKLSNQLLTFSKGGEPLTKVESIKDIIEGSAAFFLSGSKSKVVTKYSNDNLTVDVDAGQIEQVINNLILNADQAMPNGGLIEIGVNLFTLTNDKFPGVNEGKYVRITVTDHGIGIREEDVSKIFEPYYTTKKTGTGLGLTTSYSIVRRHHGYIMVESSPGIFTTFTVFLPYSGKEKDEKEIDLEIKNLFSGKILIMDDSIEIQQLLSKTLEHLGFTCEIANDGVEAISKYKQAFNKDPFTLVILDLTISGGIGGVKTLEEILKIDPKVKSIVSSGYSNDTVLANFRSYGFTGSLPKPFSLENLKKVLSQIL